MNIEYNDDCGESVKLGNRWQNTKYMVVVQFDYRYLKQQTYDIGNRYWNFNTETEDSVYFCMKSKKHALQLIRDMKKELEPLHDRISNLKAFL